MEVLECRHLADTAQSLPHNAMLAASCENIDEEPSQTLGGGEKIKCKSLEFSLALL